MLRSAFSKKLYQLFAIHRRKEIEIDADSKPDQYSNFYGVLEIKSKKCAILEKTQEIEKKYFWNVIKEQKRFCEYNA